MRRLSTLPLWLVLALVVAAAIPHASAEASRPKAKSSIVAGSPRSITQVPYQVRVLVNAAGGTYSCGGSIYDATHVITAAHCVRINGVLARPENVSVGYGSEDIRDLDLAPVAEVTMPRAYRTDKSYDVALLTLSTPLEFSTRVQPIVPANQSTLDANVAGGASALVTGWGAMTFRGSAPTYLQGVQLPLRTDSACSANSAYGSAYVSARTVCAGGAGQQPQNNPDSCQGDSGGPLVVDGKLVGIVSYGEQCGLPNYPGAYTEPSADGIRQVIDGSAAESFLQRGSATPVETSGPAGERPTNPGSAPAATTPVSQTLPAPLPVIYDRVKPTAKLSKLSCTKKRRCTIRLAASDAGGVASMTVVVARKVKNCSGRGKKRFCRTATRRKVLKAKRTAGGFVAVGTLAKASYTLTAVAEDRAGNRSKRLSKRFTVR